MIRIPFSIIPKKILENKSLLFIGFGEIINKFFPFLELQLKRANSELSSRKYLSMCILSFIVNFIFLILVSILILKFLNIENYYLFGPLASLIISLLIFFSK